MSSQIVAAPLMSRLATRRRERGVTQIAMAEHLSTHQTVVSRWERGYCSPKLACAVAYAELVDWRLVLHNENLALGRDTSIPAALRYLRRAYGLTQRDLASRLHVQQVTVAMWETRGCVQLDTTELWAAGLGLHIGVETLDGVLVFDAAVTSGRWAA